jgi:hypothetical protein
LFIFHSSFFILNRHPSEDIACHNMQAGSFGVTAMNAFIAHTTDETATLHLYIYMFRDKQLNATETSTDVNFFILVDDGITQIQSDTTESGFQACPMESLATIYILIASETHLAQDSLAILIQG